MSQQDLSHLKVTDYDYSYSLTQIWFNSHAGGGFVNKIEFWQYCRKYHSWWEGTMIEVTSKDILVAIPDNDNMCVIECFEKALRMYIREYQSSVRPNPLCDLLSEYLFDPQQDEE